MIEIEPNEKDFVLIDSPHSLPKLRQQSNILKEEHIRKVVVYLY